MDKFGISIIIPCYKAASLLAKGIESILSQDIRCDYEIIVIDDNSPDKETLEILESINKITNLSVIRISENFGSQNARNTGLSLAKYQYIFMLDADDMLNTDPVVISNGSYIDHGINILRSDPQTAFVYSATLMFGIKTELRNSDPLNESLLMQKHRVPIGLIYRKEDVIFPEPYSPKILKWQDWSFTIGLMNFRKSSGKPNNIRHLASPYYLYRIHDQTQRISTSIVCEKQMIHQTIKLCPKIFKIYYPNNSETEIVNYLLLNSQKVRGYIPKACDFCHDSAKFYCIRNSDYFLKKI